MSLLDFYNRGLIFAIVLAALHKNKIKDFVSHADPARDVISLAKILHRFEISVSEIRSPRLRHRHKSDTVTISSTKCRGRIHMQTYDVYT